MKTTTINIGRSVTLGEIMREITAAGLDPETVEIEVTETGYMNGDTEYGMELTGRVL